MTGDALAALRTDVRGRVFTAADEGYEAARHVWNGMIDRRPTAIVRCSGVADVVRAIEFGRANALTVAIRGGGHNAAGLAVCDDGLVIDLSDMRGVRVDPAARTARAQGGATWGDFDRETQLFGLATTGGAISMTGIAGLTLGGGLGWLMRSYGLACDNLVSADVVTADGRVLTASARENSDLFWGLRGGGGNFGVVTSFEFRLHEVGPVTAGMVIHPIERARDVLGFYRDLTASAPNELTTFCGLLTSPDGVPVVATLVCFNGPPQAAAKVLGPLRKFGPPVADLVDVMPYTKAQTMLDEGFAPGPHVYWRSDFLRSLTDDALDALVDQFSRVTSPLCALVLEHFGGAVAKVGRDETAFDHRDAEYNLAIVGRWLTPDEADRNIAWTRGVSDAMRSFARGVYVNYLGVGEGHDRVRAAYGPKYEKLVALKDKYDPTNFFRLNQNIQPSR